MTDNNDGGSGIIAIDGSTSTESITNQSGLDLIQFFKEALNKNAKDRSKLMRIEKDLINLVNDKTNNEITFPATSSYNRMLIHRVAEFFGMEHNTDLAQKQCVIVTGTKQTKISNIRFTSLLQNRFSGKQKKSILKQDTHSLNDL